MSKTDPQSETANPAAALVDAGNRAAKGIAQAGRKGREVISATREKGEAVISATREKGEAAISAAREKGGAVISATREKGEAVIEDTREKTLRAAAETNRLFQEHPIAAVAAAAAAGAILGIFLPRLNITGRAGRIAGRAVKAAVASEATQLLVSGVMDGRRPARAPAPDPNEPDAV